MSRNIAIAAAAALILVGGGIYLGTQKSASDDRFASCRASQVAGGAGQIGGDFTLVSETGETMTSKQVIDKPTLVYFGYTYCPDVCPLDAARNAEAVQILEDRGTVINPVFITIDPTRDTPEVLAEFTDFLHPRMLGLTGTEEQVKSASLAYRSYYKKQDTEDPDFYLMDHSTFTYLTFPEHGFAEFFRRDLTADKLADAVQCFVDAA